MSSRKKQVNTRVSRSNANAKVTTASPARGAGAARARLGLSPMKNGAPTGATSVGSKRSRASREKEEQEEAAESSEPQIDLQQDAADTSTPPPSAPVASPESDQELDARVNDLQLHTPTKKARGAMQRQRDHNDTGDKKKDTPTSARNLFGTSHSTTGEHMSPYDDTSMLTSLSL
jgi:hypothetical protein